MAEVELTNVPEEREVTNIFTGYRRYRRLPEGAMSESFNMASEEYPAASVRAGRITLTDEDKTSGAVKDALPGALADAVQTGDGPIAYLTDNAVVMYKTRRWSADAGSAKTLLAFGHGFFVPDAETGIGQQGMYIPASDGKDVMPAAAIADIPCWTASLTDGSGIDITPTSSATAPSSPDEGDYWYNSAENGLYCYDGEKWQAVPAYHTKLAIGALNPETGYYWCYRGNPSASPAVPRTLYKFLMWEQLTPFTDSETEPSSPAAGDYWYNGTALKRYDVTGGTGSWTSLTFTAQNTAPTSPIWGDLWIDTSVTKVLNKCHMEWDAYDGTVYFELDGTEDPESEDLWCDEKTHTLYKWSYSVADNWHWTALTEWLHFDDALPGIIVDRTPQIKKFRANDFIRLTGYVGGDVIDVNVSAVGNDYLLLDTLMAPGTKEYYRAERRMPYLDHAVVHDNRVWGCRYGMNTDGDFVNEIYACKLGDPTNWYSYRGLIEDSYTASVGEPGAWTGCAVLGDHVVFFKDHCMLTVYGDTPSSYSTVLTRCDGIEAGSARSAVTIDGYLFYKSRRGVMRMASDSLPELYSDQLSYKDKWSDAIGGTDGRKYYLQMREGMTDVLYVYDAYLEIWHKEDPLDKLVRFVDYKNGLTALCGGKRSYGGVTPCDTLTAVMVSPPENDLKITERLYLCMPTTDGLIYPDDATYYAPDGYESNTIMHHHYEQNVSWAFATGDYGHDDAAYKRVKSLALKLWLDAGTQYGAEIMYDEDGVWAPLEKSRTAKNGQSGTDRVEYRLRRCDLYRLRLHGTGRAVIYSITSTYEGDGNRAYGTN